MILGNSYGTAPFLYCGINPGSIEEEDDEFSEGPCSKQPHNYPFRVAPEDRDLRKRGKKKPYYFYNCHNFCERHNDLGQWFHDRFTSTFLIPWRTAESTSLWSLNEQTNGLLFKSSGEILSKMIEHHEAKLLVVAGKVSIRCLRSIMSAFEPPSEVPDPCCFKGPGGTYQWSRTHLQTQGRKICVLQVPHFSRANSQERLDECANWLRHQISDLRLD